MLFRSTFAEVVGVDSHGEDVWTKILYIKPTGLFETINIVVKRLDLTECSRMRFLRCYPVYFSTVKVPTEAIWPCHFCVAG